MMDEATALAWKILYGEELERLPDPNKPENVPYWKAQRKERRDAMLRLFSGPGKVLFEDWRRRLKEINLLLLMTPDDKLCFCPSCMLIREARAMLKLWLDAERVLAQKEQP